jgi:hypothetical protein
MGPEQFISTQSWNSERIHAMSIYCSDGRWGEAFDEFCQNGLNIPRYDRFAVPGGPLWLVTRDVSLMIPHAAARDQLQFLVKVHQLERIVIFGHYGCAYYAHIMGGDPESCLDAQRQDLRSAANTLRSWFPGIEVDAYMALRNEGQIYFRTVNVAER